MSDKQVVKSQGMSTVTAATAAGSAIAITGAIAYTFKATGDIKATVKTLQDSLDFCKTEVENLKSKVKDLEMNMGKVVETLSKSQRIIHDQRQHIHAMLERSMDYKRKQTQLVSIIKNLLRELSKKDIVNLDQESRALDSLERQFHHRNDQRNRGYGPPQAHEYRSEPPFRQPYGQQQFGGGGGHQQFGGGGGHQQFGGGGGHQQFGGGGGHQQFNSPMPQYEQSQYRSEPIMEQPSFLQQPKHQQQDRDNYRSVLEEL